MIVLRSSPRCLHASLPARPRLTSRLRYRTRSAVRHLNSSSSSSNGVECPKATLAIVGGGLSGLSSAFYFLRALSPELRKCTRVVIFEREERTGGWCKSININEDRDGAQSGAQEVGEVSGKRAPRELVFETGPRSIRSVGLQGWLTVELVSSSRTTLHSVLTLQQAHSIGLTPSILTVDKTAPSAKNRFLYTPPGLTVLPSSLGSAITSVFTTPLIRSILPGIILEPFRRRSPLHFAPNGGDESVDSFFTRRFGKNLAERALSAMIHGIYAGDSRRLSMRALFPGVWEAEREWGSVIRSALFGGLWRKRGWKAKSEYRVGVERELEQEKAIKSRLASASDEGQELVSRMEAASVWGVRGGLAHLTHELRRWLERQGVEVITGSEATISQEGRRWTVGFPPWLLTRLTAN